MSSLKLSDHKKVLRIYVVDGTVKYFNYPFFKNISNTNQYLPFWDSF